MFKSIQKSGRIAAVAIGLDRGPCSPLAAPPGAALASGSVPTPEREVIQF